MKLHIGDAIVMLCDEYNKAKEQSFILKPVSYALYQTWKFYDEKEKPRKLKEQNNEQI